MPRFSTQQQPKYNSRSKKQIPNGSSLGTISQGMTRRINNSWAKIARVGQAPNKLVKPPILPRRIFRDNPFKNLMTQTSPKFIDIPIPKGVNHIFHNTGQLTHRIHLDIPWHNKFGIP